MELHQNTAFKYAYAGLLITVIKDLMDAQRRFYVYWPPHSSSLCYNENIGLRALILHVWVLKLNTTIPGSESGLRFNDNIRTRSVRNWIQGEAPYRRPNIAEFAAIVEKTYTISRFSAKILRVPISLWKRGRLKFLLLWVRHKWHYSSRLNFTHCTSL